MPPKIPGKRETKDFEAITLKNGAISAGYMPTAKKTCGVHGAFLIAE